jgi:hypothetical protein
MDIEFHYYITYLIATKAGIAPEDARTLAYSSQYVDDNNWLYTICRGYDSEYKNEISQTMDIMKPDVEQLDIYPLLHFIPGIPDSPTATRVDGKTHALNATPNSPNANTLIDLAIASNDFYHIGITAHSYVDTWAHQNFVGCDDDFNGCDGILEKGIPNIGHADAMHKPDLITLVWDDNRLIPEIRRRDNKQLFLDAARHLFRKLWPVTNVGVPLDSITEDELISDLSQAIGSKVTNAGECSSLKYERIGHYQNLAKQKEYGNVDVLKYEKDEWFDNAIDGQHRSKAPSREKNNRHRARRWDWSNERTYKQSCWYKYQEALKQHKQDARALFMNPI